MRDIQGKTAIVTGAASGIGLGIAKALASAGANIVLADLRPDPQRRIEGRHRLLKNHRHLLAADPRDRPRRKAEYIAADDGNRTRGDPA